MAWAATAWGTVRAHHRVVLTAAAVFHAHRSERAPRGPLWSTDVLGSWLHLAITALEHRWGRHSQSERLRGSCKGGANSNGLGPKCLNRSNSVDDGLKVKNQHAGNVAGGAAACGASEWCASTVLLQDALRCTDKSAWRQVRPRSYNRRLSRCGVSLSHVAVSVAAQLAWLVPHRRGQLSEEPPACAIFSALPGTSSHI